MKQGSLKHRNELGCGQKTRTQERPQAIRPQTRAADGDQSCTLLGMHKANTYEFGNLHSPDAASQLCSAPRIVNATAIAPTNCAR